MTNIFARINRFGLRLDGKQRDKVFFGLALNVLKQLVNREVYLFCIAIYLEIVAEVRCNFGNVVQLL